MTESAGPVSGAGFFESTRDDLAKTFVSKKPPAAVQQCVPQTVAQWRAEHKDDIEKAIAAQRQMLLNRKADLAKWNNDAKGDFFGAFGDDTDAMKQTISDRVDRELALNSKLTVDNFAPAAVAKDGRYAYVHPDDADHTIFLDKAFWEAPMTGENSKGGTLCHEMSHFTDIGGTQDFFKDYNGGNVVYGVKNSSALSEARPDLAMQHADSFEYYCESEMPTDGN